VLSTVLWRGPARNPATRPPAKPRRRDCKAVRARGAIQPTGQRLARSNYETSDLFDWPCRSRLPRRMGQLRADRCCHAEKGLTSLRTTRHGPRVLRVSAISDNRVLLVNPKLAPSRCKFRRIPIRTIRLIRPCCYHRPLNRYPTGNNRPIGLSSADKGYKMFLLWTCFKERRKLYREKIIRGTIPGQSRRGRPKVHKHDNMMKWTGLSEDSLLRFVEDRTQWRKIVHEGSTLERRKT